MSANEPEPIFCPSCNRAMKCPCPTCRATNKVEPGVYWTYADEGRGDMICGNCGYNPEPGPFQFSGMEPLEFLASGWDAIFSEQARRAADWPELIG